MKPVAFDYARPATLFDAAALLADATESKILAGGQTLGPMLNLRLVQPALLVDVTRIPEMVRVEETADALVLGGCVTHAAIEDDRIPDVTNGFLQRVARGIAYRAVRTRGTLGGSLAHADPAADWLSCLLALDAEVLSISSAGNRTLNLETFVRGAMQSDLATDEILDGIRIPKLSNKAKTGYHKICRKIGEFADAIGVVVHDPDRGVSRLVCGATRGRPIVIEGSELQPGGSGRGHDLMDLDTGALMAHLTAHGLTGDAYDLKVHAVALHRALQDAMAA